MLEGKRGNKMKFYIASSLKNLENVRQVAENLKACGFQQTNDWTTHSDIDSISKLRNIGQEEVSGVLAGKKKFIYTLQQMN
jgi:hypothetical protein